MTDADSIDVRILMRVDLELTSNTSARACLAPRRPTERPLGLRPPPSTNRRMSILEAALKG